MKSNSNLQRLIPKLKAPINDTLNLLVRLVGAPADTKVLLSVDELSKTASKSEKVSSFMSILTSLADKTSTLHLSISAYGALDLAKFTTDSNRPLLFQSLPPLWHDGGYRPESIPLLPLLLQPFFDKKKRVTLPYDMDSLKVYSKISGWLLETAGQPRRISTLFCELRQFDECIGDMVDNWQYNMNHGRKFVSALKTWVNADDRDDNIQFALDVVPFLIDFKDLKIDSTTTSVSSVVESLAQDTACAFPIPAKANSGHEWSLKGTVDGYCHYLARNKLARHVHAFIPLPVLRDVFELDHDSMQPCGEAKNLFINPMMREIDDDKVLDFCYRN